MANVLFTNVRVIDATGAQPYPGEVLVQGNRIARIGRGTRSLPTTGVTVIDGAGATLMPGMCEAHTHFGWTNSKTLDAIQKMPPEEHTLWAAQVAKLYLDHGWTSCVGAATPKPRLDCVIRDAINSGQIPGPRYLAASQEITVTGSLGDDMLPHLPFPEMSFGCVVDGARRHAEGRAHVPQVRRGPGEAEPLRRQPGAGRGRAHELDERRGSGGRRARGEGAGPAPRLARALERVGEAEHAPRRRGDLPRELRRRGRRST